MMQHPISEDDLQAHIDGRLDARRTAEVEAWLRDHPQQAQRVDALSRERDALRAALLPIAEEPIPPHLNVARLVSGRRPDRRGLWQAAAAAAVLAIASGAGGWSLRGAADAPRAGIGALAQEAAASYAVYAPDQGRPVEIDASDRGQLVAWGSRRLARPVRVPDLSAAGFRLLGGRVVVTPHGPAVLTMFEDNRGTRLVMLARNMATDKNVPMRDQAGDGIGSVSWSRDGLGYSLVGPLAPGVLNPIARRAKLQFESVS